MNEEFTAAEITRITSLEEFKAIVKRVDDTTLKMYHSELMDEQALWKEVNESLRKTISPKTEERSNEDIIESNNGRIAAIRRRLFFVELEQRHRTLSKEPNVIIFERDEDYGY